MQLHFTCHNLLKTKADKATRRRLPNTMTANIAPFPNDSPSTVINAVQTG